MTEKIKTGLIGMIGGFVIAAATVLITTGSYKQKVDSMGETVVVHESRLNKHDIELTGVAVKVEGNEQMLAEMRADIKTLLNLAKDK